jgi:hypothetical protein
MRNPKTPENAASRLSQTAAAIRSFQKVPTGRGFAPWLAEMSRRRGFVKWLAGYVGRSPRQLANLAKNREIPRSENGYNRYWSKDPDGLAALIHDLRRFRKGKRRGRTKRKKKKPLTELDRLERAINWANRLLGTDAVQAQIRRASVQQLGRLELLVLRTGALHRMIERARHRI